jgi:methylation protein EvaC
MKCHVCKAPILPIINFGKMPIANNFQTDTSHEDYYFELATGFCESCVLFQIVEQPDPSKMFHSGYPFFTGLSSAMVTHFKHTAEDLIKELKSNNKDPFVVEIGSNDGTFLVNFANSKIRHLGVDPSKNVVEIAKSRGVNSVDVFFGKQTALQILDDYGSADVIFGANVICHLPNMDDFAQGIKILLSEGGKFVFEEPYVGSMIEKTAFDQIYDEHIFIFGITSVSRIFSRYGLELVDAVSQETHGGSMRYIIQHQGVSSKSSRLRELENQEIKNGLLELRAYEEFAEKCASKRQNLLSLLGELKLEGKRVAGYAATSKSTTVLNYCGIDQSLIEFIVDSTIEKQGTFTPGSHIPIISDKDSRMKEIDFFVLFAWNHQEEIRAKENARGNSGFKWISFVPNVEILK